MIECRGGKIYTGIAKDPDARYRQHLTGTGAAFTRMNPRITSYNVCYTKLLRLALLGLLLTFFLDIRHRFV